MPNKLILVLNCGSSSLKGAVLDNQSGELLFSCLAEKLNLPDAFMTFKVSTNKFNQSLRRSVKSAQEEGKYTLSLSEKPNHTGAVEALLVQLEQHNLREHIAAIGHRVVSGGELYSNSIVIDENVLAGIEKCIPLAPLHNPAHLLGIRAAQTIFKGLPNVAVFDTAFHQTMPEHAYTYAIPRKYYRDLGLRRYGAHGTSYRYVAAAAAEFLQKDLNNLRMVIAHLGNGASIASLANGRCQDTSMGLTPLEGLVMGTRSGDIDPSVFSFLEQNTGMNIQQITDMLNKQSGLLGISELSNDCRTIKEAADQGHEGAKLALEIFAYRLAKYVAAMTVASGGLDVLVFTGGIGETSDTSRAKVLAYLGFLGLELDNEANLAARFGSAGLISSSNSKVQALVIPTNEELMIAQDTARLTGL